MLDWVPAHFPPDPHGLATSTARTSTSTRTRASATTSDWGTMIFNYGRREVRELPLRQRAVLARAFHIDGLRVDAVASMLYLDYSRQAGEWIPNMYGGDENLDAIDFLRSSTSCLPRAPRRLTVAEESTAWPAVSRPTYLGGLGFSLKWNMGWMNDTLHYMQNDPVYRNYHQTSSPSA